MGIWNDMKHKYSDVVKVIFVFGPKLGSWLTQKSYFKSISSSMKLHRHK